MKVTRRDTKLLDDALRKMASDAFQDEWKKFANIILRDAQLWFSPLGPVFRLVDQDSGETLKEFRVSQIIEYETGDAKGVIEAARQANRKYHKQNASYERQKET